MFTKCIASNVKSTFNTQRGILSLDDCNLKTIAAALTAEDATVPAALGFMVDTMGMASYGVPKEELRGLNSEGLLGKYTAWLTALEHSLKVPRGKFLNMVWKSHDGYTVFSVGTVRFMDIQQIIAYFAMHGEGWSRCALKFLPAHPVYIHEKIKLLRIQLNHNSQIDMEHLHNAVDATVSNRRLRLFALLESWNTKFSEFKVPTGLFGVQAENARLLAENARLLAENARLQG